MNDVLKWLKYASVQIICDPCELCEQEVKHRYRVCSGGWRWGGSFARPARYDTFPPSSPELLGTWIRPAHSDLHTEDDTKGEKMYIKRHDFINVHWNILVTTQLRQMSTLKLPWQHFNPTYGYFLCTSLYTLFYSCSIFFRCDNITGTCHVPTFKKESTQIKRHNDDEVYHSSNMTGRMVLLNVWIYYMRWINCMKAWIKTPPFLSPHLYCNLAAEGVSPRDGVSAQRNGKESWPKAPIKDDTLICDV